jgi:glycosyltransferase involved in cell wall biosynthesis
VFRTTGTHIVPLGIDAADTPSEEQIEHIRARHNLEGRRVIISVGHIHAIRNRKDLIEALPAVIAEHPNAVLLLVGFVGDDLPARLARKLGIEDAVIFAGPVAHSEIYAYLALADMEAHWLNQNRAEETSLGIASMEAMAAGKVVLAAIREQTYGPNVLRDGENFVLVEPDRPRELARTINELLSDTERREAIGRQAKDTVEQFFSWESVCEKTIQVYRQAQRGSS